VAGAFSRNPPGVRCPSHPQGTVVSSSGGGLYPSYSDRATGHCRRVTTQDAWQPPMPTNARIAPSRAGIPDSSVSRATPSSCSRVTTGTACFSRWATLLEIRTSPKRQRVDGTARIEAADAITPRFLEAQFIVRMTARAISPDCPRYVPKLQRGEPSKVVPRAGIVTPVPAWKQMDCARDVLPEHDPAAAHPSTTLPPSPD
jgi:hypothetical protein